MSELIMWIYGWDAVWFANPGFSIGSLRWPGLFHVGVWTGPQNDLICVRHAKTSEEAEELLSPCSRTVLGAAIKSALKLRAIEAEGTRDWP